MLSEILEFIGELEWQEHKPDLLERMLNQLVWWMFCAGAGYICGQALCIYFDIGVVGEQWRHHCPP
jgi:hypothetical protein